MNSGNLFVQQSRQHACCLTGHRQLPQDEEERDLIRQNLRRKIAELVQQDITVFYAGGAQGFDTLAAMTVLEMKAQFPQIRLHLALPYPGQSERWSLRKQQRYEQIKDHADEVCILSPRYTSDCMKKRNYYMVDHSCVCAFYMTNEVRSGTAQTVKYARKQGCRMIDLLQQPKDLVWHQMPAVFEMEQVAYWHEEICIRDIIFSEEQKENEKKS